MKRYILSSKKLNYSMELWYNDKGLLCRLDMINCDMTQDQLEAFASKLNLSEKNIKASLASTGLTIIQRDVKIDFEDFLLMYPYSRNTHLAREWWTKTPIRLHLTAYFAAIDYRDYCKRNEWYKPMIAIKWLKTKEYLNDWKMM